MEVFAAGGTAEGITKPCAKSINVAHGEGDCSEFARFEATNEGCSVVISNAEIINTHKLANQSSSSSSIDPELPCTNEANAEATEANINQITDSLNTSLTLSPSSLSNGVAHAQAEEVPESDDIVYVSYKSELQMPDIMRLIQKDLSEPYSIYTYRYFIHNWPKLCFLAMYRKECVGAIVCKLDNHRKAVRRGYIAMLAVDKNYRKRKIGSNLVLKAIRAMVADDADEVVLETEITNKPALRLYENLGFVRDKRLFRYYLNGVDALRLKLWLR